MVQQTDKHVCYPQLKFYLTNNPKFGKNEVTAYYPTLDEYQKVRGLEPTKVRMKYEEWCQKVYDAMAKQDQINNEVQLVVNKVSVLGKDDPIIDEVESGLGFVRWV